LQILFSQITKNIATRAGEEGFIETSSDLEEYIMETLGGSKVQLHDKCETQLGMYANTIM
jgi:hypothetical protein